MNEQQSSILATGRQEFDRELGRLEAELILMSGLVEKAIFDALQALKNRDIDRSKKVINEDDHIDKTELEIERYCVELIRREAPMAGDLRRIISALHIAGELERIGDYAKNLSEVVDIYPGELPDDDVVAELREIRAAVEAGFEAASKVFVESDRETALGLIRKGKDSAQRADGLLSRIAQLNYDSGKTTALVLGARYYKRINGHLINVLSSVVMPLHKVDYYDEDEIVEGAASA